MSKNTKHIGIKFSDGQRATETILPNTTISDVLKRLKLGEEYQLSRSHEPDQVFRASDVLFAMVKDYDLLHASAIYFE